MRYLKLILPIVLFPAWVQAQTNTPTNTRTPTATMTITPTAQPTSTAPDWSMNRIILATPGTNRSSLPTPGSSIGVMIEVKNGGGSNSPPASLVCVVNDAEQTPAPVPTIAPGQVWRKTHTDTWKSPYRVNCRIAPTPGAVEITSANNFLDVRLDGSPHDQYMEQDLYDFLNTTQQEYCSGGRTCRQRKHRSTAEDYVQSNIAEANRKLETSGTKRMMYLRDVIVVPTGRLSASGGDVGSCMFSRMCSSGPTIFGSCESSACTLGTCQNLGMQCGGGINLHRWCDDNTDCPGSTCDLFALPGGGQCFAVNEANAGDFSADTQWLDKPTWIQNPFGVPGNYSTTMDVDLPLIHEWTHAGGVPHPSASYTYEIQMGIEDPPATPVWGTSRMPYIGTCSAGANAGLYCMVSGALTDGCAASSDCPTSICCPGGSPRLDWPLEAGGDWMGSVYDARVAVQSTRAIWDYLYKGEGNPGCNIAHGNVNSDSSCCGYSGNCSTLDQIVLVAYDGSNDLMLNQDVDFYLRDLAIGGGITDGFDNTVDFSLTTDSNGIATLGSMPFFKTTETRWPYASFGQETFTCFSSTVSGWTNTRSGSSYCDVNQSGQVNVRDGTKTCAFATADSGCSRCAVIARADDGDIGYAWLQASNVAIAAVDGRRKAPLPLWFWNINHDMIVDPDLVALPLFFSHSCGNGSCLRAEGTIANLGQNMAGPWKYNWRVNGVDLGSEFRGPLFSGEIRFDLYLPSVRPGDTVCLEVDRELEVDEYLEGNNEACATAPSL